MRTGRYSIAELFSNRHVGQLIIPEIQRDYVWKSGQVGNLLTSILDNFAKWQQHTSAPPLRVFRSNPEANDQLGDGEMKSLEEAFAAFHARRTRATNIGFIYAYCDGDLPGQYFLIDGQQRLTTVYIILLAVASKEIELTERFRARYCLCSVGDDQSGNATPTKLDYRLREHTTEFLQQCVHYVLNNRDAQGEMKDQGWYLGRFERDATIRNFFDNLATVMQRVDSAVPVIQWAPFYDYLENLVECWYFDTNESAQGEELYIYLNARGESIAENENLKALLLSTVGDIQAKDDWGSEWEEWQDYFWQHRRFGLSEKVANPNADRGFNSFLRCIENLERLRGNGASGMNTIRLEVIKKHLGILHWLEAQKESFKSAFSYAGWVDGWFSEVWETFNQVDTVDWTAPPGDNTKSTDHNRMVLVWGSLLCVLFALEKGNDDLQILDPKQIFRAVRIFYLRYHNYGRAVATIVETARGILENDPSLLGKGGETSEERAKWDFLANRPDDERRELEATIWNIEDHPLNLNGRDLGGINLTHLVDLTTADLGRLQKVREAFYKLFPPEEGPSSETKKKVASALLYYGVFWNRISPWYYNNYNLGDWRRTIRGKGSEETRDAGGTVFHRFCEAFIREGISLDEFLETKKGSLSIDLDSEMNLRKAIIWYSEKLGTRVLVKGMYVAIEWGEQSDEHFVNLPALWNTQGDFRGTHGNRRIADL